jgi:hypothetical protein
MSSAFERRDRSTTLDELQIPALLARPADDDVRDHNDSHKSDPDPGVAIGFDGFRHDTGRRRPCGPASPPHPRNAAFAAPTLRFDDTSCLPMPAIELCTGYVTPTAL